MTEPQKEGFPIWFIWFMLFLFAPLFMGLLFASIHWSVGILVGIGLAIFIALAFYATEIKEI